MTKSLILAKAIDVYGQGAMILIPLFCSLIEPKAFIYALYTLSIWQLISFVIHERLGKQPWKSPSRNAYRFVVPPLVCLLITSLAGGLLAYFVLAMVGPVFGLWYLIISVREWNAAEGRR